jgi:hypothetical protein
VEAAVGDPVTVRSQSGQFAVRGLPLGTNFTRSPTSQVDYLRLDPALTAISLERIRQAVLSTLGLPDKVKGPIHVSTQPLQQDNPRVRITSVHYTDGWGYRVALPERLEKTRFFEVAVEVMLTELANRSAGLREAELPPWLASGLAAELLATSLPTLALEPGAEIAQRQRSPDPLRHVRELLRQRPPLTFDQLAMPLPEQLEGEDGERYRACAQLFVHELLRLRGGAACLRDMLSRLTQNLNWQTSFLQAFHAQFQRLIDVDKWYALTTINVTGRDPMSLWPLQTTCQQLTDILQTSVQVRLGAGDLPLRTAASLQQILSEWEFSRQAPLLQEKLRQLEALRLRSVPEATPVLDGYWRLIRSYLGPATAKNATRPRVPPKSVLRQLDELDGQRQTLCASGTPALAAPR